MSVAKTETNATDTRFNQADESSFCPECGAMNEVDRLREGTHVFIWLECTKVDCDGQWLQKMPIYADAVQEQSSRSVYGEESVDAELPFR